MTCERVRTQISEYLDEVMAEEAKTAFEDHLKICASCRQQTDEIREALQWIKQADELEPPPGLRNSVISKLEREEKRRRLLPGLAQFAVAAAVFILLLSANILALEYKPFYKADIIKQEEMLFSEDANQRSAMEAEKAEAAAGSYDTATAGKNEPAEARVYDQIMAEPQAPGTIGVKEDSKIPALAERFLHHRLYINLAGAGIILALTVIGLLKRK
jgi:hypothetical protein